MGRHSVNWDDMIRALEAFKKEQGHCHVPTVWEKNPVLGSWAARQRFLHKLGELPQPCVDRLDQIGFVWDPADKIWHEMYLRLVTYKGKHGDCDIPFVCPADPQLASWVASQRHRKKTGSLSEERVQRLTEIGFNWSGSRQRQAEKTVTLNRVGLPQQVEHDSDEHLYKVTGEYIQYNGSGPRPPKLEKYIQRHGGDFPSSIILPRSPLVFRIGGSDSIAAFVRKIKWPGKGPLPADVLEYLNENGTLPPHS